MYEWTLAKYDKSKPQLKFTCPKCGYVKRFVRYNNSMTGEFLAEHIGKCDRETSCGYHAKPKEYFLDNPETAKQYKQVFARRTQFQIPEPVPTSYFNFKEVKATLGRYEINPFIIWLKKIDVPAQELHRIIKRYYIGTAKYCGGSVVFWQIDSSGNTRAGKIILYNPDTGKRVRNININWTHILYQKQDFNLKQCLFGIHLTSLEINNHIAIVESEKTAIICDIFLKELFPNFTWVATGGIGNLSEDKLSTVKDRKIWLFPDTGAFTKWKAKETELKNKGYDIAILDFIELNADENDRKQGYDLADYLLKSTLQKYRPNLFTIKPIEPTTKPAMDAVD